MTAPQIAKGEEYVVFYVGGPYDGQTDRRIATEAAWDDVITVSVEIDGDNSLLTYGSPVAKEIAGEVQVTYTFDAADSEPVADPEDRNEL